MTCSNQINTDSTTCTGFKYQPWSFLCEVYMFSSTSCGFSPGRLFSTFSPPTCRPGGLQIMCEYESLCVGPPWRGLMICLGHSPVHSGIGGCPRYSLMQLVLSAFLFCDSWRLHTVSILGVLQSFEVCFPDSFIWSFYEVFYMPEVRCEDEVLLVIVKPENVVAMYCSILLLTTRKHTFLFLILCLESHT